MSAIQTPDVVASMYLFDRCGITLPVSGPIQANFLLTDL